MLFHILSVQLFSSCRALNSFVPLICLQLILHFTPALLNVHMVIWQQFKEILLYLHTKRGHKYYTRIKLEPLLFFYFMYTDNDRKFNIIIKSWFVQRNRHRSAPSFYFKVVQLLYKSEVFFFISFTLEFNIIIIKKQGWTQTLWNNKGLLLNLFKLSTSLKFKFQKPC